ncbi:MAG: flavodoxin family protein [Clostridiaceae bacterium]
MTGNKVLVVYYSRTGTTKKVSEKLKESYGYTIEEIKDNKNRKGVINYILSGKDSIKKTDTNIDEPKYNPEDYDLIIIGTPVWASNMTPAIRKYLDTYKDKINKFAVYTCEKGSGGVKAVLGIESLLGKKGECALILNEKEVKDDSFSSKLSLFENIE